jgi:hypothetical protein
MRINNLNATLRKKKKKSCNSNMLHIKHRKFESHDGNSSDVGQWLVMQYIRYNPPHLKSFLPSATWGRAMLRWQNARNAKNPKNLDQSAKILACIGEMPGFISREETTL